MNEFKNVTQKLYNNIASQNTITTHRPNSVLLYCVPMGHSLIHSLTYPFHVRYRFYYT